MQLKVEKIRHPLKQLSGPEIETLADYVGQGALGVQYNEPVTDHLVFHPITKAYDNEIAGFEDVKYEFSMTTDSNRSETGYLFPMRTCIEFRAGPKPEMTEVLLDLVQTYTNWLTLQKTMLRSTSFINYAKPTRHEQLNTHSIKLSDFIDYYNDSHPTKKELLLTLPQAEFHAANAGQEFSFSFPDDAEWVIKLEYEDLNPKLDTLYFAQYNLSIPIGCVFDPLTKLAFPSQTKFSLLFDEKETGADFNESRPHKKLRSYEQQLLIEGVALADQFATKHKVPIPALGLRDFLRGMTFELAMISTSQAHLIRLFQEEALWIAEQQHAKKSIEKEAHALPIKKAPKAGELHAIGVSLANTLRKSLFSYFMKTTLAEFFNQLHPYEKAFLLKIPKTQIKELCQQAINLANGGLGNTEDHPSHFLSEHDCDSFIEMFEDFYKQTFQGVPPSPGEYCSDPIACLTTRFIAPVDIGEDKCAVPAVVIELRQPEQGKQRSEDMQKMCAKFNRIHRELLVDFYSKKRQSQPALDALWSKTSSVHVTMGTKSIIEPEDKYVNTLKRRRSTSETAAGETSTAMPSSKRLLERHASAKKSRMSEIDDDLVTRHFSYHKMKKSDLPPSMMMTSADSFFSRKRTPTHKSAATEMQPSYSLRKHH